MAKSSWRFEFVDVNKSIDVSEVETQWIGYMVVRAPKGETEAKYIPPENQARIEAMFGYASADYPDLYELIDFNQKYGVYVSAPSAEVKECPNYYGGVYLTSNGIQKFYQVTDKKKPNFEVAITPEKESTYNLGVGENSDVMISDSSGDSWNPDEKDVQSFIDIQNIPAKIFNKCKYLDFTDWKTGKVTRYRLTDKEGKRDRAIRATVNGEDVVCGTYFYPSDENSKNPNGKKNCYDIRLGGSSANAYELEDPDTGKNLGQPETLNIRTDDVPFIKLLNVKDVNGKQVSSIRLLGNYTSWQEFIDNEGKDLIGPEGKDGPMVSGGTFKKKDSDYEITFPALRDSFKLVYDISSDVYAHISQVSPSAYSTHITVDNVTYDKYVYDEKLKYTIVDTIEELPKTYNGSILWFKSGLTDVGSESGVYTYNWDTTENGEAIGWEKDESYETKKILAFEPLKSEDKDLDKEHSVFFIEDDHVVEMTTDAKQPEYELKENPLFNSFHSTSYEYDIGDERHDSYDFTGSLDEMGVDENGSDNYWEELLPPGEAVTYAEVYVDKTFDDDLDKKGVYTKTRIEETVDVEVSGQRYTDYLVKQNVFNGKTGGNVDDVTSDVTKGWAKCIRLGLEEAAAPKYEDAIIFMEPSGIDTLKTYFNAIRTNHKMATIISPKNITEAIFNNVSKMRVTNPLRGSAQYCQELKYKDRNLRKMYYSCPIGAMGAMLMRIIERKYGGVAPMWINDQGMGGQLEEFMLRAPISARWDFEDGDTQIMDQKQINPILMDTDDGIMAVSHRTTEMYSGDWGYLGHSMAFDLCKREIRDKVMKDQIAKKINDYWIDKRQEQVDKILGYRTSGSDAIWSYAKADIRSVNNEYTKAQKIFNISVEVRPNPFSEKVRLTFTNLSQITTVAD